MSEEVENLENNINTTSLETLMKELKKSEEDIKEGRTIDYSKFKEKLRIKYNI